MDWNRVTACKHLLTYLGPDGEQVDRLELLVGQDSKVDSALAYLDSVGMKPWGRGVSITTDMFGNAVGGLNENTIQPWMNEKVFVLVQDAELLHDIVDEAIASGACVVDIESQGLNTLVYDGKVVHHIVGFVLCFDGEIGIYVPVRHVSADNNFANADNGNLAWNIVAPEIQRLLDNCVSIFHNSNYDQEVMWAENFNIREDPATFDDTQIMGWLIDSNRKRIGLKSMSEDILGWKMINFKDIFPKGEKNLHLEFLHPEECYIYASSDGICTWNLWNIYRENKILLKQKTIYRIEKMLVFVLRRMQRNMFRIDVDYLLEMDKALETQCAEYVTEIHKLCGDAEFSIDSAKQLGEVLFDKLGIPNSGKTPAGKQWKTDRQTLEDLDKKYTGKYPALTMVVKYRQMMKLRGTYIQNLTQNVDKNNDGRFGIQACGAPTGRFAAPGGKPDQGYTKVNAQAVPKVKKGKPNIRKAFIARDGFVVAACVAEGELVSTRRGLIPVEYVIAGDEVWSDEGWHTVSWAGNTGFKPVLKLTTKEGLTLRLTADHRVLTVDSDGNRNWKQARDLEPEDWVITTHNASVEKPHLPPLGDITPYTPTEKVPSQMSEGIAEFLGTLMGDGCLLGCNARGITSVGISLGLDEYELLPKLNTKAGLLFGRRFKESRGNGDVALSSRRISRWLHTLTGKHKKSCHKLRVPDVVLRSDRVCVAAFLRGLFDADGSVSKRKGDGVTLWISSPYMSQAVQIMLLGLGIKAKRTYETGHGNFGPISGYRISIRGEDNLSRFCDTIGFLTGRKKERLACLVSEGTNRDMCDYIPVPLALKAIPKNEKTLRYRVARIPKQGDDKATLRRLAVLGVLLEADIMEKGVSFDQVVSVEPDGDSLVYDVSVPTAQKLTVGGIVIHNCDFAGVELRIAGNLAPEAKWISEFNHLDCKKKYEGDYEVVGWSPLWHHCPYCREKMGDVHSQTAEAVFGSAEEPYRGRSKGVNFGILYGAGGKTIAENVGVSQDEGYRIVKQFKASLPGIASWIKKQHRKAHKYKLVTTAFGRVRLLPEVDSENKMQVAFGERSAVNTVVQGASADITKIAMIACDKLIAKKGWREHCRILLTVHDEIVFEVRDSMKFEIMPALGLKMSSCEPKGWKIPLTVDIEWGPNWGEATNAWKPPRPRVIPRRPDVPPLWEDDLVEEEALAQVSRPAPNTSSVTESSPGPEQHPTTPEKAPEPPAAPSTTPVQAPKPVTAPAATQTPTGELEWIVKAPFTKRKWRKYEALFILAGEGHVRLMLKSETGQDLTGNRTIMIDPVYFRYKAEEWGL